MGALKTIDKKGRVTLGPAYAGRQAKIEDRGDEILITFHKMVPDREAWLWENENALMMVKRGLAQTASHETTAGPDLAAAFEFAEGIPDETE